jgi:hypothetical protein
VPTVAEKTKGEQFHADAALTALSTADPENVRARFAAENHAFISDLIRFADEKAGFYFGASAAILYLLFRDGVQKNWWQWLPSHPVRQTLGLTAMLASGLACAFALVVVTPRRWGSTSGHIFFGAIAQFRSRDSYADEVMKTPDDELIREKLSHCYELARICGRKYKWLRLQVWSMILGLILSVGYYLFS